MGRKPKSFFCSLPLLESEINHLYDEVKIPCEVCGSDKNVETYELNDESTHYKHLGGVLCSECKSVIELFGGDINRIMNLANFCKLSDKCKNVSQEIVIEIRQNMMESGQFQEMLNTVTSEDHGEDDGWQDSGYLEEIMNEGSDK